MRAVRTFIPLAWVAAACLAAPGSAGALSPAGPVQTHLENAGRTLTKAASPRKTPAQTLTLRKAAGRQLEAAADLVYNFHHGPVPDDAATETEEALDEAGRLSRAEEHAFLKWAIRSSTSISRPSANSKGMRANVASWVQRVKRSNPGARADGCEGGVDPTAAAGDTAHRLAMTCPFAVRGLAAQGSAPITSFGTLQVGNATGFGMTVTCTRTSPYSLACPFTQTAPIGSSYTLDFEPTPLLHTAVDTEDTATGWGLDLWEQAVEDA